LSAKSIHFRPLTILLVLVLCLALSAIAIAAETPYGTSYSYQETDFSDDTLDGIVITGVPSATVANICYGNRVLRAGDILTAEALSSLTLEPLCTDGADAVLTFLPVQDGKLLAQEEITVTIGKKVNEPPAVEDSSLETYKNIANTGRLSVKDPEGGAMTYTVITEPKRGTVEISDDGTYVYTPNKNKVGTDTFTYVVTDDAGNISEEATVTVEILKPSSKTTYADMTDDPDAFTAMWLKEQGIFTGETVGSALCFNPDATVTRGEFLVMLMDMLELEPDDAQLTSGFADESDTPAWLQPYVVSALSNGIITGISSEAGMVFRPDAVLTNAEAAVMVQNILNLPDSTETSTLNGSAVPAWAEDAVCALADAGIFSDSVQAMASVTRRDAAKILYAVSTNLPDNDYGLLAWAAE
jgi:hypothetical protein